MKYIKNDREIGFSYFILKRGLDNFAYNGYVFAKAGNSLIVQPGTNAQLKIYC